MKTCPVCALDLEDTYLFCPDDGSSLVTLASKDLSNDSTQREPSAVSDLHDETAGAVVLYCPTCSAEYPLTFSACPVHGVELTKHKIPRLPIRETVSAIGDEYEQTAAASQQKRLESKLPNQLTSLHLERPRIETPRRVPIASPDENDAEISESIDGFEHSKRYPVDATDNNKSQVNYAASLADLPKARFERPGIRVAAIATIIALGLFAIVALYTLVSNLSRRPASRVARVASETEAAPQALPYIPTPQEAQDYKDEQPAPAAAAKPDRSSDRAIEKRRDENTSASSTARLARKTTVVQTAPKPPVSTPTPAPARTTKVSNPPPLALPRGNSAGFDARLVRVRGRETPSGFRYDLTFNMQEQAGRSAQWQRVLITTRSVSGKSHSESIPFQHRLGATGALTFTISVELAGHSEPDWQGRVVCTTLGWDNNGAPLQASFGANVTPW